MQVRNVKSKLINALARSWVYREDDVNPRTYLDESVQDLLQIFDVIDVGWPMQSHQCKALGESISRTVSRSGEEPHQRVNHHVADAVNFFFRNSFLLQMGVSVFGRSKQQIREPVRDYAIDLFRHGAVKRAKPSLDMANGDEQLGT